MSFTESKQSLDSSSQQKYALESKKMGLQAGLLGKVFGVSQMASINIAGLIAILLIFSGVATLFFESKIAPSAFWEIIVPILSMILGFLFGKKS